MYLGATQLKVQYAIATFGWQAEVLGYWMSSVGVTRAVHLLVILPLITKVFKPKALAISLPVQLNEPLLPPNANTSSSPSSARTAAQVHAVARFDIRIAHVSLFIDALSYIVLALSEGPSLFVAGSLLLSFGGGFNPSAQSLAMYLTDGNENGKLFGALAVISTLGSQVVGPAVFGTMWINTVDVFPKAIFVATATGGVLAFGTMLFIRLPQPNGLSKMDLGSDQEASL